MVICLERDADLHMAQLIPLPLTVFCSSKIQIGFTFLVPAHLGSPGQRAVKRVCVCYLLAKYLLALRARVYSARASRAHSQPGLSQLGLRPCPPLNINALHVNLVNLDIVDDRTTNHSAPKKSITYLLKSQ